MPNEEFEKWAKGAKMDLTRSEFKPEHDYINDIARWALRTWHARQPEIDALKAEVERLRADAERLAAALRATSNLTIGGEETYACREQLAAIDAAMKETK